MSATQSNQQPTQGELLGSFIKLAHEFADLAEQSRLIAEQYIRVAQERENIIGKDADPLDMALQTLSNTGRAIKMFKDSLDGMEKASRTTGTEQHREQSQALQNGTMEIMNIVHPGKTEKLQRGISRAILSFYPLQDWFGLSKETIHETIVEHVLDGLGFAPEYREQTTINHEHCHWLRNADRSIVALLVTDHRETPYGPEPGDTDRLDARQEQLHRETGFDGRFVFTNGMKWRMYSPDEPGRFQPVTFTLQQPDGFWDLFMLSLTQDDLDSQHPS